MQLQIQGGREDLLKGLQASVNEMDKDQVDATKSCICFLHDALVAKSI